MKYIDLKYLRLASVYLDGFKEIADSVYNFRCPVCGDSKRSRYKKRGYVYLGDDVSIFKCYNCGMTTTLYNLIKRINITLSKQYVFEQFEGERSPKHAEPEFKTGVKFEHAGSDLFGMQRLKDLDGDHPAVVYAKRRKIPDDIELYYAPSVNAVRKQIDRYKDRLLPHDQSGLVIPFRDEDGKLIFMQSRSITDSPDEIRYLTFLINEGKEKFWGLDKVDYSKTTYLFEGPIDAMMVSNGVAFAGGNLDVGAKYFRGKTDLVIVFDKDYITNKEICKILLRCVRRRDKVVLYDDRFTRKDANAMIAEEGWSREDLETYLKERTFQGLSAQLELSRYKLPVTGHG